MSEESLIDAVGPEGQQQQQQQEEAETPNPKRKRRNQQAAEQQQENEQHTYPLEYYVEQLPSVEPETNRKFRLIKSRTTFLIKALPEDPEALLAGIFNMCVENAILESTSQNMHADHLGCLISSPMLDPDIWLPIRPITENTVDSILNRFLLVAQSKRQQGLCLWGEPFSVHITTLNRKGLPSNTVSRQRLVGGAPRRLAPIHHRISNKNLIKINNSTNKHCLFYALQATLISGISGFPRWKFFDYMHSRFGQAGRFEEDTRELMRQIGVPMAQQNTGFSAEMYIPKVIDHYNRSYSGKHSFRAFVFKATGHYKPAFEYGSEDFDTPLILYYDNEHFDGVQKANNLFGQPYCLTCRKPYHRDRTHSMKCRSRCQLCSRHGPPALFPCKPSLPDFQQYCQPCGKTFLNADCYSHHLKCNFCKESKRCADCGVIWSMTACKTSNREGHVCHEKYCKNCGDYHDSMRGCFIKPINPAPKTKPVRIIAFDCETTQHQVADPSSPLNGKHKHVVNFIAARVACPDCIESGQWKQSLSDCQKHRCAVCGHHRIITFNEVGFRKTPVDKQVVTKHPLMDFVKWLLYELPAAYDSYIYSHYGGKFDMVLVFKELLFVGFNPQMLRKGNKMYEMKINARRGPKDEKKNGNLCFRDSFNLMNMKLESLVPSFGLEVEDKGFFPHLANIPSRYGQVLPGLPPKNEYMDMGFMPTKKRLFDIWYDQHKDEPFLLEEELASYCCNDVEILMSALVAFRAEFLKISRRPAVGPNGEADRPMKTPHEGIDPLIECMTIASASMKHFRANHLRFGQLALVPEKGYDHTDTQSLLALKTLKYLAEITGEHIQHAHTPGGEKRIGAYRVDGWVESRKWAIEINGCAFHGCPNCYDDEDMLPTGRTAAKQREKDKERLAEIKKEAKTVDVLWECEIMEQLEFDTTMRQRFKEYLDEGPLNIRSCFMGGRTAPLKLYHKVGPGERISYLDVTSLYPFVNYITRYPIGHPKVHVLSEPCFWARPEDNPYKLAILKVLVRPPWHCAVPILPMKIGEGDERLLFPLCGTCARENPQGGVDGDYTCRHSDEQRSWVSYCTSVELDMALAHGYAVTKVYRVLEYTQSDDQLFRGYMREFLAEKFHASGFYAAIKGDAEAEAEFLRECLDLFGIKLDPQKMIPNKGRRALVKLMLNNLWGRFSLRNFGLVSTMITDDPAELADLLDNRSVDVMALDELTPEQLLVSYQRKRDWIDVHECSNVVVSIWTTSVARLMLLTLMQAIECTPGCTLLYTDTDSVIFCHPENVNPFLKGQFPEEVKIPDIIASALPADWRPSIGLHLGDLTVEHCGYEILEFVSGGAKQYGLKMRRVGADPNCAVLEYVLKLRGFTLNEDILTNQGLRYENFKRAVLDYAKTGKPQPIPVIYPRFIRSSIAKARVVSERAKKVYKPFISKGIICPETFVVRNFGFISPYNMVKMEEEEEV